MLRTILTVTAASAALLTVSACTQQRATDLPPGTYESSSQSTNARGTTMSQDRTTEVEMDRYGNKSATTTTKTTNDPKGLFNKSTTQTKTTTTDY